MRNATTWGVTLDRIASGLIQHTQEISTTSGLAAVKTHNDMKRISLGNATQSSNCSPKQVVGHLHTGIRSGKKVWNNL